MLASACIINAHWNVYQNKSYAQLQGPAAKKAKFGVDAVHYTEEVKEVIQKWAPSKVYLLDGTNSDR